MFKYTPKKQILRDMQVAKVGRWWDTEYYKRQEILKKYGLDASYILQSILQRHYHEVCFYSEKRVRAVPVNGYLFPVKMFREEIG